MSLSRWRRADSGEFGPSQPTLVVGSSSDAAAARKWVELDGLDGYYTWTARQMIDHFGFIEANRIAATLWQTVVGHTRYFHISLNQIMADRAKEKEEIPDEIPPQKDAQM